MKLTQDSIQQPLVHVIIPKWVTQEYTFQPVPRFIILLEATVPVGTATMLRNSGRVTDYFVETWRTPTEIREYIHKFDMVAVPVNFAVANIEKCPRRLSLALSREQDKYCVTRSDEDEKRKSFLQSLSCGLNSGRRRPDDTEKTAN